MNDLGPERYQSDRFIRKLLRLAGARNTDIFYDLGCGIGQLCVVAVTEFDVKKAVGIESHRGRAKKAEQRVKELSLDNRIEIRNEDFWQSDISEATIAYYGLNELDEDVANCEKKLSPWCRVITLSPVRGSHTEGGRLSVLPHATSVCEDGKCFAVDL
jgi:tRNA A58 N-methylase Trm61